MLNKSLLYCITFSIILSNFFSPVYAENSADISSPDFNSVRSESFNIEGDYAILIDANSGLPLYEKNPHGNSSGEKIYPASITKILTALIAIEESEGNYSQVIEHSHEAVFGIPFGSSHIGMRENEIISLDEALHGVMLASANDVCVALAEHFSGSIESFAKDMNKRAKEAGAINSNFVNPHGFHDPEHYTTPYDMAQIMRAAIKEEKFVELISTTSYQIPPTNIVDETRWLNNSNRLIKQGPYYYEYCIGGKTGFTNEAGQTLVIYAKRDDVELISVVMKETGTAVFTESIALLEYGFSMYNDTETLLISSDDYTSEIEVNQRFEDEFIDLGSIEVKASSGLYKRLPSFVDTDKIKYVPNLPVTLEAPIKLNQEVGTLDIVYENHVLASVGLTSADSVDEIPIDVLEKEKQKKIKRANIISKLKIVGAVVAGIILASILISIFISVKKKKNHSLFR